MSRTEWWEKRSAPASVAWPFAAGFGEDPRNPSILVRNEAAGAAAYVAAVWVVAGLVVARRARAGQRPPA